MWRKRLAVILLRCEPDDRRCLRHLGWKIMTCDEQGQMWSDELPRLLRAFRKITGAERRRALIHVVEHLAVCADTSIAVPHRLLQDNDPE